MPLKFLFATCLALSFSHVAMSAETEDADAIQGTWMPATAELAGQKLPDEFRTMIKLVITDGKYAAIVAGKVDQGTFKLDPAAKPKAMDINSTEGPAKGKTLLAIYELDGDKLRICYDLSGKTRPMEFKTKADTQLYFVVYEREKR